SMLYLYDIAVVDRQDGNTLTGKDSEDFVSDLAIQVHQVNTCVGSHIVGDSRVPLAEGSQEGRQHSITKMLFWRSRRSFLAESRKGGFLVLSVQSYQQQRFCHGTGIKVGVEFRNLNRICVTLAEIVVHSCLRVEQHGMQI